MIIPNIWLANQDQRGSLLLRGVVGAAKQLKRETHPTTFLGGEVILERRPHGVV